MSSGRGDGDSRPAGRAPSPFRGGYDPRADPPEPWEVVRDELRQVASALRQVERRLSALEKIGRRP
jgi:hypothetical protein